MISTVERYLETLLSFVPRSVGSRFSGDFVAVIHVPADGPEQVYSLTLDSDPVLTVARYRETVWDLLESAESGCASAPQLDALQAQVPSDHPVFEYLDRSALAACENISDGIPGLDYYLMIWQKDGAADVVECWEPYGRDQEEWLTVIGALQALSGQYEYAARAE